MLSYYSYTYMLIKIVFALHIDLNSTHFVPDLYRREQYIYITNKRGGAYTYDVLSSVHIYSLVK